MPNRFATAPVASVLVGVLVALAACGDDGSPKDVTRAYLDAVASGDGKRGCALMTGDFQRATVESSALGGDTCKESLERFSRLLGEEGRNLLREAELSDEGSGASGSAWVRIRGDERTPLRGELVTLREVDDKWKLDSQIAPGG